MAILKIARMGHPVLISPAQPVADPNAPEIRRLIADMAETLADAGGVGLAAPQVHVPLRLVIVPAADGQSLEALINPVIEPEDETTEDAFEGCLSLPGMLGRVRRWARLRYRAQDIDGQPVEGVALGFRARVIQHECDHLDGRLYPSRIADFTDFGFVEEMRQRAAG